jgi:5-oxoprolinase (ATP-hydrolysing) subunit A
MIFDPTAVAERVVEMASSGTVVTLEGERILLSPGTICFHADHATRA